MFVRFQGKPFSITVIQVYALTSNAEEAEVEWFSEDLQDLLALTPKGDVLFIIGDWNAKVGIQELDNNISHMCIIIDVTKSLQSLVTNTLHTSSLM